MTIIEDTLFVARETHFSFMVPYEEAMETLALREVPADFPELSLRGLKINEAKLTNRRTPADGVGGQLHQGKMIDAVRIMFVHEPNVKSKVKGEAIPGYTGKPQ